MNQKMSMNNTTIQLLVLQAQHGDNEAFNALYREYQRAMLRFALLRVKDSMIAEDLVQNVWLKVSKRIRKLNDTSLFRSWLFRALRWEILDWIKSNKNHSSEANNNTNALLFADDINLNQLIPMLAQLAESEKEVVELHYLNGLSIKETALALEIPEGTVKSRLSKARDKLRASVYEEYSNEI